MLRLFDSLLGLISVLALTAASEAGDRYYVASHGSDSADGRSDRTAWQTLERVNSVQLKADDAVLFRRGDSWRGQLQPQKGDPSGHVTYGAYGSGEKPVLMGSVGKSAPGDWLERGEHIWATTDPSVIGPELLPDATFRDGASYWNIHVEGGAQIESGSSSAGKDNAYRIQCVRTGQKGSDIQFYTGPISLRRGSVYRLHFRARSTRPFRLTAAQLMQQGAPWANYARESSTGAYQVSDSWYEISEYFVASQNAADGRLTFYLGGAIPAGATLLLDAFSFVEVDNKSALLGDVGNVIFDGGPSCGTKVWQEADLKAQGDFWYDRQQHHLKMYSMTSPASQYRTVECAMRPNIIEQSNTSWVIYENLSLRYGGAHGIGGSSTHHIIVRDCDFSFIGGADQYGDGRMVRFGNAVEFWGDAQDNLVERCEFWEIYDAALTNQNNEPGVLQARITYRRNLIWNCEYSFEYWNRPESSRTRDIVFEHNTCVNAGGGWGHRQRSDPSGRHLCFYSSAAQAQSIGIRNNIFCLAQGNAFYAPRWSEADVRELDIDHNCWCQPKGVMMSVAGRQYSMENFSDYQAELKLEPHSIAADPRLVNVAQHDFRLREDSPCINAGF